MNTSASPHEGGAPAAGHASPAGRHRLPRRHRWLAVLAAVCIGYLLAGFIGVPYLARRELTSFVRTQYGRNLQVGAIHFNPLTFRLEADGVSLPDADGRPMLGFARLTIQPSFATVWRFAPSLREIVLEQPSVHAVVRADGSLNLADLARSSSAQKPAPAAGGAPMRLYIDRVRVVDGAGELEDHTLPGPFVEILRPINFDLRNFSTRAGSGNLYELTATAVRSEAHLKWTGSFALQPLASHGSLEVTGLPLRTLWAYARAPLKIATPPGSLALHARYDAVLGATPRLTLDLADISVTGLALRPEGAAADYVSLPSILVSNTHVDLGRREVSVGKVVESGGGIDAWMARGGAVNLLEMLPARAAVPATAGAPSGRAAPAAPAGGATAPWKVSVADVELQHLKIAAEDRQVTPAAKLAVEPLDVKVTGFSTAPGTPVDISVNSTVNGGTLTVSARVVPDTSAATATVDLAGLSLAGLQPYLTAQTGMTLLSGSLGTHLGVERKAGGALAVKGDVEVKDLRTVDDEAREDFIRWKDLRVNDIDYASQPQSLKVGTVTVRSPYARVIVFPDLTTNISEILTPRALLHGRARKENDQDRGTVADNAAAAQQKKDAAPPPPPQVKKPRKGRGAGTVAAARVPAPPLPFPASIKSIVVVDGSANYTDHWIQPNFAVGIQTLSGSVNGLSTNPKSRAQVKLDGKVDRYAPAHIGGVINVLSAATYSDIQLSFQGIDMTSVTPYSGHFAGYKIDKGKLSVDLNYKIENRQLQAEQHFVINQLQLGDKVESKDAVKLPLKLAIALLKDRNGVIDIGLPMTGSLDDPQFQIGPLIWKAFLNLMGKIVTAPFAALGHLFGGGETMNVIEFAPGSAELDADAKKKLESVIKALTERPALQLDVPAAFTEADRQGLAQAHLTQQLLAKVPAKKGAAPGAAADPAALADPAQHFKLLLAVYRAQANGAELPQTAAVADQTRAKDAASLEPAIRDLEAAVLPHMPVTDSDLEQLGAARAQAIEDGLVAGGVDAARVFVVKEHHEGEGAKSTSAKVSLEMGLK